MEATWHVAGWDEGRETNNDSASHPGGGGAVLSRYSSYFKSQALNHSYLLWIYYLLWIQEAHNPCNLCSNDIKLLVRCLWHNKTNYVTSHGIFQNLCTQLSCNCCTRSHGRTAVYFQLKMQQCQLIKVGMFTEWNVIVTQTMSGLLLKKKAIIQIFQNPELQHDHMNMIILTNHGL